MDGATYQRQLRGAISKRHGQLFEEIITGSCHRYFTERKALIIKTPEPMKPVKDLGGGKFIAHYEKAAQPDYKGLLAGGQMVLFEAKHTDADRLRQDAVTNAQAVAFDYHESLGAICFVLVSFGFNSFYKIPWQTFKNMKELYGRKYIKTEDVKEYEIKFIGGVLKFLG